VIDYSWYLRGKFLVIQEADTENGGLKPPSETIADGLMIEMTRVPDFSGVSSENDLLPIPEALEEAIVYYVQAKLSQDPNMQEYLLQKFQKKAAKFGGSRIGGARVVKGNWLLR